MIRLFDSIINEEKLVAVREASDGVVVDLEDGAVLRFLGWTMEEAEAQMVAAGLLEEREIPLIELMSEEARGETVTAWREGYRWLAMDDDGRTYAYALEPARAGNEWIDRGEEPAPKELEATYPYQLLEKAWRIPSFGEP